MLKCFLAISTCFDSSSRLPAALALRAASNASRKSLPSASIPGHSVCTLFFRESGIDFGAEMVGVVSAGSAGFCAGTSGWGTFSTLRSQATAKTSRAMEAARSRMVAP